MKPVSDSAFSVILESYLEAIHEYISNATELTLENIISDTNPDAYIFPDFLEDNDFNDFTEDWVCDIYEWTSTPKGLEDYLIERINNENEDLLGMSWSIGDTYEVEGEIEECDYKDIKSFMDNVYFDQAVQILKECWERACKTDMVFSDEEVMRNIDGFA